MLRNSIFIGSPQYAHLEADEPAERSILRVIVNDDARNGAVEDLHDHVAARDQVHLVPIILFDERLQLVRRLLQVADDAWLHPVAVGNVHGLTSHRQKTAATFFIDFGPCRYC